MARHLLLFITTILLSSVQLSARTISGTVFSDADSTALTGASCRLLAGEKLLAGIMTGEMGAFRLETDEKSSLTLEISLTGYNPTEILIENGTKNIGLGTIFLNEGHALAGVTVTANAMADAKGRTIIYPSAADIKASATTLGLIQKLPLAGLDANPVNRSISVDGGSPMILINGVPATMDDLNALQPKDIDKIEFSRISPARYADRGTNGLISITLKKRSDGGQIYTWIRSALNTTFFDANLQASYHQGPSQFTLSYVPSWRNYQKVYDNVSQAYIGDDFRVDLTQNDRNPFNYAYHQMRLKYDFQPSEKTLFSATFRAMPMNSKHRVIGRTDDSFIGSYPENSSSTSHDFTPSLDLFLRHDFNASNSLEAQVVGTLASSDYRHSNTYIFDGHIEQTYATDIDSRRRSLISEINYNHSFNPETDFSAGVQNTISRSTNTYLTSDYRPVLTENNNYIYARLSRQIGKVYISLSSGAKLFWIKNDMTRRHFIRNLSNILASWNINSDWNIRASFQYAPSIPSLASLTDYPQQSTPYLISNGNPGLKVSERLTYAISATYRYRKFAASLYSAFLDVKHDVISDLIYLGDRMFLSQSVNARKRQVFQNDLQLKLSGIAGFGANVNLGVTHYNSAGAGWNHHLTSFDASMSLWWNKGPYTISYWRKIPGKYLSGHYVGKEENGDALSFEYKPDRHWTLGIDWMYMFDSKGTRYPAWNYSAVNPSVRERHISNNSNMVVLSVSYSADFGSIFRSSRRSLNNSDTGSSILKLN